MLISILPSLLPENLCIDFNLLYAFRPVTTGYQTQQLTLSNRNFLMVTTRSVCCTLRIDALSVVPWPTTEVRRKAFPISPNYADQSRVD